MNKRVKQLWLEALRSGEYDQTVGRLQRTDADGHPEGFCCLGVLCDLYRKETGRGEWDEDGYFVLDGDAEVGAPQDEVAWWAGIWENENSGVITQPYVEVDWDEKPVPISEENDRFASFAEIADIIEEQL